jgi:hypothetical protein
VLREAAFSEDPGETIVAATREEPRHGGHYRRAAFVGNSSRRIPVDGKAGSIIPSPASGGDRMAWRFIFDFLPLFADFSTFLAELHIPSSFSAAAPSAAGPCHGAVRHPGSYSAGRGDRR